MLHVLSRRIAFLVCKKTDKIFGGDGNNNYGGTAK